jgi:hypothetical protein
MPFPKQFALIIILHVADVHVFAHYLFMTLDPSSKSIEEAKEKEIVPIPVSVKT